MKGAYKQTAKVGITKAALRFIEDPNRSIFARIFLAAAPILAVYILSPLDLMPEVILGPIGLTDDVLILIGIVLLVNLAKNFYAEKRYYPKVKIKDAVDI